MNSSGVVNKKLASRMARASLAAAFGLASTGCASLKQMTVDFNRKWDDPKAAMSELETGADKIRASSSSSGEMAAINANDCARQFGLHDSKSDAATTDSRRISAGECLLDQGRDADALDQFAAAGRSGPSALASQGAGIALIRLGRIEEAHATLEEATTLDATLWRAWNALGVAKDGLGATQEAWAAFQRASELNPADGAALNNLGVSKLKMGLTGEATAAFREAMSRKGARETAEANLRLALAYDGDYAGAVKALPDGRRAVALNNAGVAAVSRGDKAEAKKLFERAIEESPSFYSKAYNNLTLLLD